MQLTQISSFSGFPVLTDVRLLIHSFTDSCKHSETALPGPGTGYRD